MDNKHTYCEQDEGFDNLLGDADSITTNQIDNNKKMRK